MTAADIKIWIDTLTDEERFIAAAHLHHLAQENDSGYQAELSRRMARMNSGRKVPLEEVLRVHQLLEKLNL